MNMGTFFVCHHLGLLRVWYMNDLLGGKNHSLPSQNTMIPEKPESCMQPKLNSP